MILRKEKDQLSEAFQRPATHDMFAHDPPHPFSLSFILSCHAEQSTQSSALPIARSAGPVGGHAWQKELRSPLQAFFKEETCAAHVPGFVTFKGPMNELSERQKAK